MMDVRDGFVGNVDVGEGLVLSRGVVVAGIAAFNEEVYIGSVVLRVGRYVDEVVVVDDGSCDCTGDVAELAGARVIRHGVNLGKGRAIQTLLEYVRGRGDVSFLVLLDGDCQHNPDEIPGLVERAWRDGADIVNGSRFLKNGGNSSIPLYRRFGQAVLTLVTNFNGTSVTDSQSGFRVLSRRAIENLEIQEDGMAVESEMLQSAREKNLKIVEHPITCRYDVNGSTLHPLTHGLSVLTAILGKLIYKRPLLYFLSAGTMLLAAGSGTGIYTLHNYLDTGSLPFGPTIAVLLLLTLGSLSVFSGIILHTITKILKEIQKE